MANVQQVKHKMRNYIRENKLAYSKMNLKSPRWGLGAWRNARRISRHKYGKPTRKFTVMEKLFYPPKPQPAPVKILRPDYKWNGTPVKRTGPPPGIVWHHAAGYGSPLDIHRAHLNIGDRGIAYHFYVRLDGRVYAGRPENTMGAHCLGHNDWLGVCAEGNYQTSKIMPTAQLKAMQSLHAYLHKKYGGIPDKKHKDMSGNATACPGTNYPFDAITK